MRHQMRLNDSAFERIKSGKKIVEIRLFDEKRQKLNLGEIITFSKRPDLIEQFSVEVTDLFRYGTFQELVNHLPLSYFGYSEDYDKKVFAESLYRHYTPEEEQKYGVVGIKMRLI